MKTKALLINLVVSLGFAMLLGAGITLFQLRAHKYSKTMAYELNIRASPSEALIIKDQFLIFVPKIPPDLDVILDRLNLEISMPILNWLLVSKKGLSIEEPIALDSPEAYENRLILNSLLEHPHIIDAQHNYVFESALNHERHLDYINKKNPTALNMPPAWQITRGSPENTIAIVDDFLLSNNFTFAERFLACSDRVTFYNPYGEPRKSALSSTNSIPHGEIMLLALGACNNEKALTLSGIDSFAKLLAVQRSSKGQAQSFLAALAASGIDVCNESPIPCPQPKPDFKAMPKPQIILLPFANNAPDSLQFSANMIEAINNKNIIIITAAGNNALDASSFFPGASAGVINTSALNQAGKRASFSNWGPSVDIFAPGDSIAFSYPSGQKYAQGTSIAAAYAAGVVSLMLSLDNKLTHAQARFILQYTGTTLGCENYCAHTQKSPSRSSCADLCCEGSPRCLRKALNAYDALKQVQSSIFPAPILALDQHYFVFLRGFAAAQKLKIQNQGDREATIEAQLFDSNLALTPSEFVLLPRNAPENSQEVLVNFKKEPFKRTIHKIRFVAKYEDKIVDWADIYLEYVPKN